MISFTGHCSPTEKKLVFSAFLDGCLFLLAFVFFLSVVGRFHPNTCADSNFFFSWMRFGVSRGTQCRHDGKSWWAEWDDEEVEIAVHDRGNRKTPRYFPFTDRERLIKDAAVSQTTRNSDDTVVDEERLIAASLPTPLCKLELSLNFAQIVCSDALQQAAQQVRQLPISRPGWVSKKLQDDGPSYVQAYCPKEQGNRRLICGRRRFASRRLMTRYGMRRCGDLSETVLSASDTSVSCRSCMLTNTLPFLTDVQSEKLQIARARSKGVLWEVFCSSRFSSLRQRKTCRFEKKGSWQKHRETKRKLASLT